jgi:glycosyltransferase involved in cell wall biosynthesis
MTVFICLCTCRRPQSLDRSLMALRRADLGGKAPGETALVVVDNAPDGEAAAICDRHRAELPVPLVFVEEPQRGISFARNRAVAEALQRGADFIAFLDDDDVPDPAWLQHLMRAQQRTGAELVFGFWRQAADPAEPSPLAGIKFFQPPKITGENIFGLPQWAGTFNVLIARAAIERVASDGAVFRPQVALTGGGDMDFFIRATRAGAPYATATESKVVRDWEPARLTRRGIIARAFRLGGTQVALERCHLDAARIAKRRRKRLLSSGKVLAKLILAALMLGPRRQPTLDAALYEFARRCGEINAYLGGRYRYYR